MMPYSDLFTWWAACISGGSIFLTLVSVYLYVGSRSKRREAKTSTSHALRIGTGFIFVWVLLSLLVFYIVSISMGSTLIFALGNIVVEALLLAYLLLNKTKSQ